MINNLPARLRETPPDERLAVAALALMVKALEQSVSPKKRLRVLGEIYSALAHEKRRYITYDNVVALGTRQVIEERNARFELMGKAANMATGVIGSEIDRSRLPCAR